ncbi:MAG: PAS domain-containing protein, partial [Elioraea sp.]|nr:PAS domain-containing protein [Elioraea sp.]
MSEEEAARLRAELVALQTAYEALVERERRLLDFTEASGDWFWEQDETLRFTFVSVREPGQGARALTQRPNDALLGRRREELALREPGDEETWAAHLADLAARRPFRDFVYRANAASGPMWVRVSGVPVFGRDGRFRGYRGVARKVTAEIEAA